MTINECKVGMRVIWKDDLEEYGTVIGKNPYHAIIEKWDSEAGETYIVTVNYSRLGKAEE